MRPSDAYMRHNIPTLLRIMACRLFGAKPLPEPMLPYYRLDHEEHIAVKLSLKFKGFHEINCTLKCRLRNVGHFVWATICYGVDNEPHRLFYVRSNYYPGPNFNDRFINSLRSRQNRRHFAEDVFKCNLLNENVWIPIKISLKFVPKGPINNNPHWLR